MARPNTVSRGADDERAAVLSFIHRERKKLKDQEVKAGSAAWAFDLIEAFLTTRAVRVGKREGGLVGYPPKKINKRKKQRPRL